MIISTRRNKGRGNIAAILRQAGLLSGSSGTSTDSIGVVSSGTPTGDGTMDFSIATGDDTGLLALLEDI